MKAGSLLLRFLKILSLLFFIGFLFFAYYHLPQQVSIHYNNAGAADYFVSKQMLFYVCGAFIVIFNTALSLLNRVIYSIPAKLFGMPNRTYWLADSDNQQGFREIVRDWLNSLVLLINIFLISCLYSIYSINTSADKTIADYTWLLNSWLVLLVGWIIFLPIRLRIKRKGLLDN